MEERELTDEQYDAIMACLDKGDAELHNTLVEQALEQYHKGIEITPSPKHIWETSLHLYVAIGDAYFILEKYEEANEAYQQALKCPEALQTGYLWHSLGQAYYELNNMSKAEDALMRAYMLEGKEIFGEDLKYYECIKPNIEKRENPFFLSEKDTSVYKTFKGKDYTKEEWEAFEKEQWEKYKGKK